MKAAMSLNFKQYLVLSQLKYFFILDSPECLKIACLNMMNNAFLPV